MQAALHAQLMQGMPSDNGLQQAMQAVATHAEDELNRNAHMLGSEGTRRAGLPAGRPPPLEGTHLLPPASSLRNTQHSQPQAYGTGMSADPTLQLGRGGRQGADLDTPLLAEHPIESFFQRERSRAGIGRGSSEQLELDRLQRAAERMGSQSSFIRSAETRAEQDAMDVSGATRGSISHPPMLPGAYPPISTAGEFSPQQCLQYFLQLYHLADTFAHHELWPNAPGQVQGCR